MQRVLYSIEDYFEDRSASRRAPWWARRLMQSVARTIGEVGDIVGLH